MYVHSVLGTPRRSARSVAWGPDAVLQCDMYPNVSMDPQSDVRTCKLGGGSDIAASLATTNSSRSPNDGARRRINQRMGHCAECTQRTHTHKALLYSGGAVRGRTRRSHSAEEERFGVSQRRDK